MPVRGLLPRSSHGGRDSGGADHYSRVVQAECHHGDGNRPDRAFQEIHMTQQRQTEILEDMRVSLEQHRR